MQNKQKKTTISLSEETKEQLAQFEQEKGESFDEILTRVMSNASNLCNKSAENNVVDDAE